MQVHMVVRVDVVQFQPASFESFELRSDFACELTTYLWQKEISKSAANEIGVEFAVTGDQVGNFRCRKDGLPTNHD